MHRFECNSLNIAKDAIRYTKDGLFFCFKNWAIPGRIFLYSRLFNTVDSKKKLLMTGFELRNSGIGSDRSTRSATTSVQGCFYVYYGFGI